MSKSFSCPQCQHQWTKSEIRQITSLVCPDCGKKVVVARRSTPSNKPKTKVLVAEKYVPPLEKNLVGPSAPAAPSMPSRGFFNQRLAAAVAAGIVVASLLTWGVVSWFAAPSPAVVAETPPPTNGLTPSEKEPKVKEPKVKESPAPEVAVLMFADALTSADTWAMEPLPREEEPARAEAAHTMDFDPNANIIMVEVQKAPTPATPLAAIIKRRQLLNDEELRRQLILCAEIDLDTVPKASANLIQAAKKTAATVNSREHRQHLVPMFMAQRADLSGLPFRMGVDCQLGKEPAENLQALSRKMRGALIAALPPAQAGIPADVRPVPDMFRPILEQAEWRQSGAVPTMQQMLQVENTPIRRLMIDALKDTPGTAASEALVNRALFDLSADIRAEAVKALASRPAVEYRDKLIAGLRYPWAPVADHAAEALVALNDRGAVPMLEKLLDEPEPNAPYYDKERQTYVVREVVRINHLRNCLLCHAPSTAPTDLVRGRVPVPGEPLPPPTVPYYESNTGIFVRADVTYLRQDFSVHQPVQVPNAWPVMQRYDYVVRVRPVTPADVKRPVSFQQREAILFALAELDADWKRLLAKGKVGREE
ncbi:MAG: HEAT repeat domain-containing protein [Gemmataceae bacterium]